MTAGEGPDPRKVKLIMDLRRRGISDPRVLAAMEAVERERFLPPSLAHLAYVDQALPIDCGQTISQPYVVALMSQALNLAPEHKVLEVGTGSGYQTAILARLADRVWSIERWPELAEEAAARLDAAGATNVELRMGDGALGWPEAAPFDRIIVTAASAARPDILLDQLAEDGVLIAPVGFEDDQVLTRYEKHDGQVSHVVLAPVRFVPLLTGVGGGSPEGGATTGP
jgi:protein-L-isoaspartate(D-aspartate) O-methyltransferase